MKVKKYNYNLLNYFNVCFRLPFLLSFLYLLAELDIDKGISHVLLVNDLAVPVLHIRNISKHSGLLIAWGEGGGQKDQDSKMKTPLPPWNRIFTLKTQKINVSTSDPFLQLLWRERVWGGELSLRETYFKWPSSKRVKFEIHEGTLQIWNKYQLFKTGYFHLLFLC